MGWYEEKKREMSCYGVLPGGAQLVGGNFERLARFIRLGRIDQHANDASPGVAKWPAVFDDVAFDSTVAYRDPDQIGRAHV